MNVEIPAPMGRNLLSIYRVNHWVAEWEDASRNAEGFLKY